MSDGGYIYRAGDIVHHEPTGEDWVVAYVDGEYLAWCGWPAGEAKASDCWLKKSSSDAEHLEYLREIAKSSGKRARRAQAALDALTPTPPGAGCPPTPICPAPLNERSRTASASSARHSSDADAAVSNSGAADV